MAEKTVNYTAEQTAFAVQQYQAGESVEAIATKLNKTVRSVVAKLSREKVYQAKSYVSKTGEKPVQKEELVAQIANVLNVDAEALGGLEKANKTTLQTILKGLLA